MNWQTIAQEVKFTYVTLVVFMYGNYTGMNTNAYCIGACLVFGTAVGFHCAPLWDDQAFHKIREKNKWTLLQFHIGNFLLHIMPFFYVVSFLPNKCSFSHGLCAAATHLVWGLSISFITSSYPFFCLNHVYVPFEKHVWIALWIASLVSELCGIPLLVRLLCS